MPMFGKESLKQLGTCHPRLQLVLNEAIKYFDFTVVCGYRNKEDQDKAYAQGFSKKKFPYGEHNKSPSKAVDLVPYPTGYRNEKNMILLAGQILGLAASLGVKLRWGGDWNTNNRLDDENGLIDYPHFELEEKDV